MRFLLIFFAFSTLAFGQTKPKLELPPDPYPTFEVATDDYILRAIAQMREMPAWEALPAKATNEQIKARLILSLDMNDNDDLAFGLKRFQRRHGLSETGKIGVQTLKSLNIPKEKRIEALEFSLARLKNFTFTFGERYVVVNIPSAEVELIENGEVKKRHLAIVGKPDRATPQVESRLTVVNFNPTWTVPTSIIKKDMIPKMQKDPQALSKMKIKILDRKGQEVDPSTINWQNEQAANYTLRQDAGAGNSLGQIRIDMPNTEAVFMHDTPSKRLFKGEKRFHSSGCVRVEHVRDFAAWLLEPQNFSRKTVDEALRSTARKDLRLTKSVPVAWVYLTGWAEKNGRMHFRDDIYGFDKVDQVVKIARAPVRRSEAARTEEPPPEPPQIEEKTLWQIFFPKKQ